MRNLNPLIKLLPLAAAVLASYPDLARAQALNYTNPAVLQITGPGASASQNITVSSSTTTINSLTVGTPTTNNGTAWLCATASASLTITVSAGVGCGVGTGALTANTTYQGQVNFFLDTSPTVPRTLNVTLQVGGTSTGVGLTASPNPLTFNVASGSGATSQTVSIFNSGVLATLQSVSATTTTGQAWLSPFISGSQGIVTVGVNPSSPSFLGNGSYSGTVNVQTTAGAVSFTVNLNVGTGGSSGLAATALYFNPAAGSAPSQQYSNVTCNGTAISATVVSSSTNTGQNWLQAFNTGVVGTVGVTVTPANLFSGSDIGNVTVNTACGTTSFQVTLTIGGGSSSGLVANPNPITFNVPFGSSSAQLNVSVTSNGSVISVINTTASTANGQAWLSSFNTGNIGQVTVTVNPQILNSGFYTGSIFINTTVGSLTVPVNLTIGGGSSSSGLTASPNPVNFNIPIVGSGVAPQTVTFAFNGFPTQVTGITNSAVGQSWLIVDCCGGTTINVRINGANLTAGTYSATLTVTTTSGTLNLPINLTVGSGGTTGLVATPNPVILNTPVGGSSSSQQVTVTYNGSPASVTGVTTSTATGQNWLQATTSGGSTFLVTANPGILSAGGYTGTVAVSTTVGQVNVQVNLNVGGTGGTGLIASPNPVTMTAAQGGTAASQTVSVTSNGTPVTITGISASTTSGGSWLQPFTSGTQGSLTVNANTSTLSAGSYSGTVTVTTVAGTTTFQVNLTIGSGTGATGVIATPNPVTFTETTPGGATPITVSASLNGVAQIINTTTFVPAQIGLTFINTVVNGDGTVTLTVNNTVTTPGLYQGTLTLYTNGGNVTVPVTLQFGTGGGTTGLVATPNPVNFTVQPGGSVPAQTVNVTFNGFGVAVTSVSATTTTGQNWLLPSLSGTVGQITVNVNALGLLAGGYSGSISAATGSGTLTIQVNLTVGTGGGPPGSPTVVVTPTTLSAVSFQIGAASGPQPQTIAVSMVGGGALGFTAGATTTSGGPWLSVSPATGTTPGSVTVTINTAGLTTAGTFQGLVTITVAGATNSPVTLPITLTVTTPPVVTPTVVAVQNYASALPTPLSPGLNILIFGSNMGPVTVAQGTVGSNGAMATTVSGTQVTFDGVPAAIIFTSATQVSAMVPYSVGNRATTSMVVTYNGVSSAATAFRVADTAPGIYTLTMTGSGQGAILNQNSTINSANNPESAGNIIQIYMTGEGQTSPGGSDGAITPARLPTPTPVLPVSVIIGGITVPTSDITFAGEAPGIVSGVMQVNARIPAGVGTGPVSIVVRVGGVNSQSNVTVSVR